MTRINSPGPLQWFALLALVVMWGTRFYAVELALVSFSPLDIVFLQLAVSATVLWVVMAASGLALPRDLKTWAYFNAMAVVGNGLPFFLESWGQVYITSSLAGILLSVSPLSVLLLAHWFLPDEPASPKQSVAFVVGLAGVIVLIGPDALLAIGGDLTQIVAQLAVLGAAVCYGLAAVITRLAPLHPPRVIAAGVLLAAALQILPIWLWQGGMPPLADVELSAILAVVGIGLFCTALAALVFFYLILHSGAAFQSLSNYLLPVWAVLVGFTLLDESLPANAIIGMVLILVALWLTRVRKTDRNEVSAAERV
ncbi:MAG: DMT family transporter [Pseudomonadota bacterium]